MDDEEIRPPPTTHLIAIVDDLTDMLDFDSEDIDGMDDDAGEEQEPLPTGRWTATSSYDIYMVDTPKENNGDDQKDATEDNPLKINQDGDESATQSLASTKMAAIQTQP